LAQLFEERERYPNHKTEQQAQNVSYMFKMTLIAGIGGFVGTCLRFLSEKLGAIICHQPFPLGTFMANMIGCLAIGCLYGYLNKTGKLNNTQNTLWITGFCGGFTTFSSFSDEMMGMIQTGQYAMFWFYLLGSISFGISMVALGASINYKSTIKS